MSMGGEMMEELYERDIIPPLKNKLNSAIELLIESKVFIDGASYEDNYEDSRAMEQCNKIEQFLKTIQ